jgi:hypothetical protein
MKRMLRFCSVENVQLIVEVSAISARLRKPGKHQAKAKNTLPLSRDAP